MTDLKQVKVDNWGIYFLQRLKHFFNRTDYCDLTLQFQDNAQLKVHRLVLNACTEYFELLERTCEMYEDCLIMPEDLQADVVVPIVNFMYTGQLEFKTELLERLFQTSQIMNMPVLTKLLDAQRSQVIIKPKPPPSRHSYGRSPGTSNKRPYTKTFEPDKVPEKRMNMTTKKTNSPVTADVIKPPEKAIAVNSSQTIALVPRKSNTKKQILTDPRPTRYEVPEELDSDNIFDDSFHNISYESRPLMVHPETSKWYKVKKPEHGIFSEASSSRKFITENSSLDLVECRKIKSQNDSLFEDSALEMNSESNVFETNAIITQSALKKDSNQLFDQVFVNSSGPKVTIEAKDPKQASNSDHAKIISEVLKKYPHLVNSNKNIKLKILDNQPKTVRKSVSKKRVPDPIFYNDIKVKLEPETETYEEVLNSKEAAKLISMGAENIKGPWICLICGTPGKALHFPQYYKFRRHLVEVHNEKPIPNLCEYCGLRSNKRNYLLHHLYTKHGLPPPPNYNFPKCNLCSYIALTEGFLVKHKAFHAEYREFRCNVCFAGFKTSNLLLQHIQTTGHKYCADRKSNLQCIYCFKLFLRESNLYAHLKTNHKMEVKRDGIVDDSDEEGQQDTPPVQKIQTLPIKYEPQIQTNETEEESTQVQYNIRSDGNIQVSTHTTSKPRILNRGIDTTKQLKKRVRTLNSHLQADFLNDDISALSSNNSLHEEIITNEQDKEHENTDEFYMATNIQQSEIEHILPDSQEDDIVQQNILQNAMHKSNMNQPIQIVMSNEQQQIVNSGQPVVFDADGNPSKALAVLTTLDNASSNDVMIIPDDYSLNVSEAMNTKNSNIVVVYSHPMSDQTKQSYIINPQFAQSQIISQDMATHFVSTSAVITPNFATIDSSAPIISGQVVVSQPFSGDVQQEETNEHVSILHNQELPSLTSEEEEADIITINPVQTDTLNAMQLIQHEQPDIQAPEMVTESTPLAVVEHTAELGAASEGSVIENIQNVVETVMEVHTSIDENVGEDSNLPTSLRNDVEDANVPSSINDDVEVPMEQEIVSDEIQQDITVCERDIDHEAPCEADSIIEGTSCVIENIHQESLSYEEQNLDVEMPLVNISKTQPEIIENAREQDTEIIDNNEIIHESQHEELPESPTFTQCETDILLDNENVEAANSAGNETVEAANSAEDETAEADNIAETEIVEEDNIAEVETVEEDNIAEVETVEEDNIAEVETVDDNSIAEVENVDDNNIAEVETVSADVPLTDVEEPVTITDVEEPTTHVEVLVQSQKQIESLASEWSEDDEDITSNEKTTIVSEQVNENTADSVEVEESIENIQQELKKQMNESTNAHPIGEVVEEYSTEKTTALVETEATESTNGNTVAPIEKISSLLKDWEENETQEENDDDAANIEPSQSEGDSNCTEVIKTDIQVIDNNGSGETEISLHTAGPKKVENYKSLVSDWDEEDE